jgi:hypothetical protein
MSLFSRYKEYRSRKEYEKSVRYRMNNTPYGSMYGQAARYGRGRMEISNTRLMAGQEMKEKARKVFLAHPAATDQDFERCWPTIRDEIFVRYTLNALVLGNGNHTNGN